MKLPNSRPTQVNIRVVEIEIDFTTKNFYLFSSSQENERTTLKTKRLIILKVGSHDPILVQLSFKSFLCIIENSGVHTIQFSHPSIS